MTLDDTSFVKRMKAYASRPDCIRNTMAIVDRIEVDGITGDLVECGVFRAGHMLVAKLHAANRGYAPRRHWLYDTFTGMPQPDPKKDFTVKTGKPAMNSWMAKEPNWNRTPKEEVQNNFAHFGLLDDHVRFVQGLVEKTLQEPQNLPNQIAYLRLDTDFYSSTKMELEVLYPRLVRGGFLVIDDYGFWRGSQTAVCEYFHGEPTGLTVVDGPARMLVKA